MPDAYALRQLQRILESHGLQRALLLEPQSLSWLLGARWNIRHSMHDPVFSAVVHADSDDIDVLAATNEAARLQEIEFASSPQVRMHTCGWWEDRLDLVPNDPRVGCDQARKRWTDLSAPIGAARLLLSPDQQRSLRELTAEVSGIVEEVALQLTRSLTELQVSAQIHAALLTAGIDPLLVLVGSGDRLRTHLHPLPTAARIGALTMISVGARRTGVVTSVTRYAHFGRLPSHTVEDYARLLHVEAAFLGESRAGMSLEAVFRHGIEAYGRAGLAPDQWRQHHQGGVAGFSPREVVAGKGIDLELAPGHVVAWNPSAHGLKVEDIAIVGEHGCEPLFTDRGIWPTTELHGRTRPHIKKL